MHYTLLRGAGGGAGCSGMRAWGRRINGRQWPPDWGQSRSAHPRGTLQVVQVEVKARSRPPSAPSTAPGTARDLESEALIAAAAEAITRAIERDEGRDPETLAARLRASLRLVEAEEEGERLQLRQAQERLSLQRQVLSAADPLPSLRLCPGIGREDPQREGPTTFVGGRGREGVRSVTECSAEDAGFGQGK